MQFDAAFAYHFIFDIGVRKEPISSLIKIESLELGGLDVRYRTEVRQACFYNKRIDM